MDTVTGSRRIEVERRVIISSRPFDHVLARLEAAIGRPDLRAFARAVGAAASPAELQRVVHEAVGASGLMEMARFDLGQILRKETDTDSKILRLVVGNPLVIKALVEHVRDAASYVPMSILVDRRPDGVYLSYDTMASVVSPYGDAEATAVAEALDAKVAALLAAAAL